MIFDNFSVIIYASSLLVDFFYYFCDMIRNNTYSLSLSLSCYSSSLKGSCMYAHLQPSK
jgi:hypothetical protein